jgi:cytochrome c biogenesis protein CcdA
MLEQVAFLIAQNRVAVNFTLPGIIALIAGILILVYPRILNYVVALYLIVLGVIEVFDISI